MDIIDKIKFITEEGTVSGDIATNDAQGSVDIINKNDCPDGYVWDEKKKICILKEK